METEIATERQPVWGTSKCDYITPFGCLAIDFLVHADDSVEWCYGRCGNPNASTVLTAITEEQFLKMVGREEFDGVRERMLAEFEAWKTGENN